MAGLLPEKCDTLAALVFLPIAALVLPALRPGVLLQPTRTLHMDVQVPRSAGMRESGHLPELFFM